MPVVSNTSPVLNLAIIDQLSLLHAQFYEIWLPSVNSDSCFHVERLTESGNPSNRFNPWSPCNPWIQPSVGHRARYRADQLPG